MEIKDLVIVEIASVLAGPSVGMFFAELGAKVIKIEPKPIGGDVTRSWKLPVENQESKISAYFSSVNYHKEYHFFDFLNEDDYQKTIDFILTADVLITNFKKGDDVKFKLDYQTLKVLKPQLIVGAINGFGEESDRVAYDLILQAESGFMSMNGTSDSGPIKMPVALIDILAGHQLKEGILLGLLTRESKGGASISVSLFDTAIASLANQASNYLMAGHIAQPLGSLHPNIAPYGEIFKTTDNAKITFAIGSQKQFVNLVDFFKLNYLAVHESYSDNRSRVMNREALAAILAVEIQKKSLIEILNYCHSHFIPVAEIKNMKQVFDQPEAQKMVLSEKIEGVETKRVSTVAFSMKH